MMRISLIILALLVFRMTSVAHEMRPALLQITQVSEKEFAITWKVPRRDNMVIQLKPVFPDWFVLESQQAAVEAGDGALYRFRAHSARDIHRMKIKIEGIEASLVDVLIYIKLLNGEKYSLMSQPARPSVEVPEKESLLATARAYLVLGVEHILMGPDHLLFVFTLLLIVTGARKLFWTITSFTIAHSLTLSLAVLGVIGLPGPPVEATIALSIVFLAWELLQLRQGRDVISARKPWLVSFVFGLLHGMGFASALHDVGLPQTQVPAALAFFNLGVEFGQLLFIFVMTFLGRLLLKLFPGSANWKKTPPYIIGSMAAFWLIDRVAGFFA